MTSRKQVCLKSILIRVIEKFGERFQFKRSLLSGLFLCLFFLKKHKKIPAKGRDYIMFNANYFAIFTARVSRITVTRT